MSNLDDTDVRHQISQKLGIKVLLVDDQPMIAEGIRRMLADEDDITLHYCQDPSQAINMALEVQPTIVLQDLVLPDIDGMTIVRFFRANENTREIPIIVLSSNEDPKTKSEAFGFGANDYIVKLPDKIELIARIRSHSKQYLTQLERDAAFFALREMQKQLEKSNAELKRISAIDGLTGIANRRSFNETLEREWKRAFREKTMIAMILIDIDHFKLYNDTYGHLQGDECLQQVARTLQKTVSRPADLVARYGGEEFSLILPLTDKKGAMFLADKMKQAVAALQIEHSSSKTGKYVTISQGVVTLVPSAEQNSQDFIQMADKALYRAKENGRDQAVFFDDMDES